MIKIFGANKTEYFCQRYWQKTLEKNPNISPQAGFRNRVLKLHKANFQILSFSEKHIYSENELRHIYKTMDLELKQEKTLGKKMTFWRGISEPTHNGVLQCKQEQVELYNKCLNLKKGDILYMKEYPFVAKSKTSASRYIGEEGIMFKIKADKDTKVLFYNGGKNYGILSRANKYICTGVKDKRNEYSKYRQINLKLIPFNSNEAAKKESVLGQIKKFFRV